MPSPGSKDLIQDALKSTRGNRAKAARLLDTTERVLNYKVKNTASSQTVYELELFGGAFTPEQIR